ncbi:MAG: M48 family metallopeptidase [Rhodospirillales bacterium]|nr:M48 family metallopeptidase [Rhodospirillales bacterium]
MQVPIRYRRNAKARQIILRIDQDTDGVVLTLPKWASQSEGLALLSEKADWVVDRLRCLPGRVLFEEGAELPYLDEPHLVRHFPEARRGVFRQDGEIRVSGGYEYLPRRLDDWLRKMARAEISDRAYLMAHGLGVKIERISVRDTRSRWGSCSPTGCLSFSWRLIMAPEWVLHYVVAHEVAHLVHLDHSAKFWAVVNGLNVRTDAAREWLNRNTERLQRVG